MSSPIAPAVTRQNRVPRTMDSTLLIDATLKYPMAPLALPAREFMELARRCGRNWDCRR